MKYVNYINDGQQTNLSMIKLSKIEKLKEYRIYLYNDLFNKLKQLQFQKKVIINSYVIAVKELDNEISVINSKKEFDGVKK